MHWFRWQTEPVQSIDSSVSTGGRRSLGGRNGKWRWELLLATHMLKLHALLKATF